MLKKLLANRAVRKMCVFSAVFAVAGAVLSTHLLSISGSAVEVYAGFVHQEPVQDPDIGKVVDLWSQLSDDDEEFESAVRSQDSPDDDIAGSFLFVVEEDKPDDVENGFAYSADIPLSEELQKFTYYRCVEKGLEYELVLALMWRESRFETKAVNYNNNGTRDNGIMQINDINKGWLLREHGIDNLMDPYQNILAGTIMLDRFINKYDLNYALMAYQYGESGMLSRARKGISTNTLVSQALEKRDYFKQLIQDA